MVDDNHLVLYSKVMDNTPADHQYMTAKEAAIYLRVHVETVRRLIKTGKIKVITVGRRKRIPISLLLFNT